VKGNNRTPVVIEDKDQRLFFTSVAEAKKGLGWYFKKVIKNNIIDDAIRFAGNAERV
jgi:hypothetical protein